MLVNIGTMEFNDHSRRVVAAALDTNSDSGIIVPHRLASRAELVGYVLGCVGESFGVHESGLKDDIALSDKKPAPVNVVDSSLRKIG